MSVGMVLLPLFVQVGMTLVLGVWLAGLRTPALRRGEVQPRDIALREPNWPRHITQVSNSFLNQFELPVLFYLLTVLELITKQADLLFVALSWVFVLSRLVHAFVHVTSNDLRLRGGFFGVGALVLIVMWAVFIVRILVAAP
jgi:hypothetical protein